MHLVWHFSLLLMQKMLMSSQKVKGVKDSETRTLGKKNKTKKNHPMILQHSGRKCENVRLFPLLVKKSKWNFRIILHWMWGLNNRTSFSQCKISLKTNREGWQLEWKASTIFLAARVPNIPYSKDRTAQTPGNKIACMICMQLIITHNHKCFQKCVPILYYPEWSLILYITITQQ